jgi:dihydroflavonol-4-reductase
LFAINVEGTRRVLRAAREAGVARVVVTSSVAALGLRNDDRLIDESMRFNLRPHDFPYGYSKYLAEEVALHAVTTYGQEVVIVNPAVVLGPGDLNIISGRFITEMLRLQWTIPVSSGGVGVVDVRDVARWHLAAVEHGRAGERYILGTANYSLRDWYAMCAQTVGVAAPFIAVPDFALPIIARFVDIMQRIGVRLPVDPAQTRLGKKKIWFDYAKTHRDLGPPQVEMTRSLRDTYDWYQANGYIKHGPLQAMIRQLGHMFKIT